MVTPPTPDPPVVTVAWPSFIILFHTNILRFSKNVPPPNKKPDTRAPTQLIGRVFAGYQIPWQAAFIETLLHGPYRISWGSTFIIDWIALMGLFRLSVE